MNDKNELRAVLSSASDWDHASPRPALQRLAVQADLIGPLLDVTAEQIYRNDSDHDIEVVYTFPLPLRAVLTGLDFQLGDRRLAGTVSAKKQATAKYEEGVQSGDAAVLVERERDGRYTVNLGNLKPGEQASIRLRYGQLIEAAGAAWRVVIPTVLAPLYGDPVRDGGLAPHKVPRNSLFVEFPFHLAITLRGYERSEGLQCTSHDVDLSDAPTGVQVTTRAGAMLDRDFILLVPRTADATAIASADLDGTVAIASFVAPSRPSHMPPTSVRVVLDCSGSMAGESMDWATVACQRLVGSLRPGDEFSITRFGSRHEHWQTRMAAAEEKNRTTAQDWLFNVTADLGGTEMEAALRAAAELKGKVERSDIVLITDGDIWATDSLVRWARGAGLRIYVVGVGASPNSTFLEELAQATAARCEVVTPGEDLVHAVDRIGAGLRAPRVQRLEVTWPEQPAWSLQWPAVVTAGDTVHCIAGLPRAAHGEVTIIADGATAQAHVKILDDPTSILGRIAAMERIRSGHFDDPASAAERYQLVTEWTSLVAVAARNVDQKADGLPALAPVEHMVPAGWGGVGRAQAITRAGGAVAAGAPTEMLSISRDRAAFSLSLECRVSDSEFNDLTPAARLDHNGAAATRQRAIALHRDALLQALSRLNRRVFADRIGGTTTAWSIASLRGAGLPNALLESVAEAFPGTVAEAIICCALVRRIGQLLGESSESVRAAEAFLAQQKQRGSATLAEVKSFDEKVGVILETFLLRAANRQSPTRKTLRERLAQHLARPRS